MSSFLETEITISSTTVSATIEYTMTRGSRTVSPSPIVQKVELVDAKGRVLHPVPGWLVEILAHDASVLAEIDDREMEDAQ
jgi:hypothetical protein